MMSRNPFTALFAILPALGLLVSAGCEDPDSLDEYAYLDEDDDGEAFPSDEFGLEAPDVPEHQAMLGYSLLYGKSVAGWTIPIPNGNYNDAAWAMNAPNNLWGDVTVFTADIVHNGFLNGNNGLHHLAVLTRGTTVDSSLTLLQGQNRLIQPWGANAALFWGEYLQNGPTVPALVRGRGPTFWPKSSGQCNNQALPCMQFENYSNGGVFGPTLPLSLTSQPFQIKVETDDADTRIWVWQAGQLKGYASCRQFTGNDARCGRQVGDSTQGDILVGAVMMPSLANNFVNQSLGLLNPRVEVWRWEEPGCQSPYPCDPY